jgi:hypothetical protein
LAIAATTCRLAAASERLDLGAQLATDLAIEERTADDSGEDEMIDLDDARDHPSAVGDAAMHLAGIGILTPEEGRLIRRTARGLGSDADATAVLEASGLDADRIALARPFVARSRPALPALELRMRASMPTEEPAGVVRGVYAGDASAITERLSIRMGNVEGRVVLEKDPGEASLADFAGGTLRLAGGATITDMMAGDFTCGTGLGLVLSGMRGGTGGDPIAAMRRQGGALAFHSGGDGRLFFRGVGATAELGGVSILGFASRAPIDARMDNGRIASIDQSGLHRTQTEIGRVGSASLSTIGARIGLASEGEQSFRAGATFVADRFSNELSPGATTPRSNTAISADASVSGDRSGAALEAAFEPGRGAAATIGASASPSSWVSAAAQLRALGAHFSSLHGGPYAIHTDGRNELGASVAVRARLDDRLRMALVADMHRYPSRTATHPLPSTGFSTNLTGEYGIGALALLGRVACSGSADTSKPARLSTRLEAIADAHHGLTIRACAEASIAGADRGALILVGADAMLASSIGIYGRVALFQTDSYNSRLYAAERDVHGAVSTPALYGHGRRLYGGIEWTPLPALRLEARASSTVRPGVKSSGSGNDAIAGDAASRVEVQCSVRY